MNLTQRCHTVDEQLIGILARRTALTEQLTAKTTRMAELAERKAHLVKCVTTLDTLIQTISAKGIGRVELVVTNGLQLVFGPNVSCVLEKKEGARGTSYRIKIKEMKEDGEVIDDPMDAFGGGVVNLTAFLLRVLLLHRFKLAKLLVLDETMNNVSRVYLPKVSVLLRSLAEDYGFTILAVTHQPEMTAAAHNAYEVSAEGPFTLRKLTVGELT
jgi:ABC-type dipeptide/oligopeptide/nickel transport system ATPase component